MYTGTLIDDLIRAVEQVEAEAKPVAAPQSGMIELQMFMKQMQYTFNAGQVRAGIA